MWIVDQMVTVTSLALNIYIVNKPTLTYIALALGQFGLKKPVSLKTKRTWYSEISLLGISFLATNVKLQGIM